MREVECLQQAKKHERDRFVARASEQRSKAHVMRNGEGGTVPSMVDVVAESMVGGMIFQPVGDSA